MVPILFLSFLGCASPFEGTWLFMVDRDAKLTGDCVTEDYTETLSGSSNAWVDIYRLQSGEFAVLLSEPLVGTVEGSDLEASWEYTYTLDDYAERSTLDLEATLEAGLLSGSITSTYRDADGDSEYACSQESDFTAERTVSSPDSYPDN